MTGSEYQRKLTAVVQLTDSSKYEGGQLELYNVTQGPPSLIKEQGTVFLFPSVMEHAVTPVTKGTRYSLACWFDGPHWS
jgi:PKHD-type hydroxylase